MVVASSIIIFLLGLYKKKSTKLYYLIFMFMWLLMAFTYGNADEEIYMSRYSSLASWSGQTEILYALIIKVFNGLGLSFWFFKASMAFIQLFLVSCTIRKFSKFPNLILILYVIFPFTIDIAQMRNALATSIVIFFLQFLIIESDNRKKYLNLSKNEILFIIGVLIATMIHTASIIWLVLLIAEKYSIRQNVFFAITFFLVFSFVVTPENIVQLASIFGATSRISAYVSSAYSSTRDLYYLSAIVRVAFYATSIIAFCRFVKAQKKTFIKSREVDFMLKINIAILCIIPIMINYTTEVYRMQVGISIINYIVGINCIDEKHEYGTVTIPWNLIVVFFFIIFAIGNLYLLVLGNENFYTVFEPVFKNNLFFDLFKF